MWNKTGIHLLGIMMLMLAIDDVKGVASSVTLHQDGLFKNAGKKVQQNMLKHGNRYFLTLVQIQQEVE